MKQNWYHIKAEAISRQTPHKCHKFCFGLENRDFSRLRNSEFTQNFWVFSVYIADFWQTFWVIWENRSKWSNLMLNMSIPTLGRLKPTKYHIFTIILESSCHWIGINWRYMHFLWNSMFVPNGYFCRESKFVVILRPKLRFLLRKMRVDSDFTQNFWVKNWQLGSLPGPSCSLFLQRLLVSHTATER